MKKELAIQVGTILLTALDDFWRECYSPNLGEDFDWWYGISNDWDVNISWSFVQNRLIGSLYPVDKSGNTITDKSYPLTINDKAVII